MNLTNDNHCLAITTQSSRSIIDPPKPVVDDVRNNTIFNNVDETEIKKLVMNNEASLKPTVIEKKAKSKGKVKEVTPPLKSIT